MITEEQSAKEYAYRIQPNPDPNYAPYYCTGEQWDDLKDAFLAGIEWQKQQPTVSPLVQLIKWIDEKISWVDSVPNDYNKVKSDVLNATKNKATELLSTHQLPVSDK